MTTRTARKSKGKKTTEVRKKKDPNKIKVEVKPGGGRNPHAEDALSRKPTRGHKRKERDRNVAKGHSRKPKHKGRQQYASPARVASMYLLANRTKGLPTKIEATYHEVGRNGRWILEVRNSPYQNNLTATDWPKFLFLRYFLCLVLRPTDFLPSIPDPFSSRSANYCRPNFNAIQCNLSFVSSFINLPVQGELSNS